MSSLPPKNTKNGKNHRHLHDSVYPRHPPSALIRKSPLQIVVVERGCSLFSSSSLHTTRFCIQGGAVGDGGCVSGWTLHFNLCVHGHDCVTKEDFGCLTGRGGCSLFPSSITHRHTNTSENFSFKYLIIHAF